MAPCGPSSRLHSSRWPGRWRPGASSAPALRCPAPRAVIAMAARKVLQYRNIFPVQSAFAFGKKPGRGGAGICRAGPKPRHGISLHRLRVVRTDSFHALKKRAGGAARAYADVGLGYARAMSKNLQASRMRPWPGVSLYWMRPLRTALPAAHWHYQGAAAGGAGAGKCLTAVNNAPRTRAY